MPRIEVHWDGGLQEHYEVEVTQKKRSPDELNRRRKAMAQYIIETGATLREVAAVFGLHNSNVYRAMAGLLGSPYTEVQQVWIINKALSIERANAARKAKVKGR